MNVEIVPDASYEAVGSPGRFFAANELKAMMAYLVINYDIKFENEGIRPKDEHTIMTVNPDSNARVLFRKRKV